MLKQNEIIQRLKRFKNKNVHISNNNWVKTLILKQTGMTQIKEVVLFATIVKKAAHFMKEIILQVRSVLFSIRVVLARKCQFKMISKIYFFT
jgi:hypothetical protein